MRRSRIRQSAAIVGAGQTDRRDPGGAECRDEARVHRAGQHRHDDVERGIVGYPQTVHLTFLDAGGPERRIDLLAAAVDDDDRRKRCVAGHRGDDRLEVTGILEELAADFYNHRRLSRS